MISLNPVCISEYGTLFEEGAQITNGQTLIRKQSFENLWNYILANSSQTDADSILSVHKKGKNRFIKAHKYVGTIQTADGLSIEILPKIYRTSGELESDASICRKVFLTMLKHFPNSKAKSFQEASLSTKHNFPILEVYIANYVKGVQQLISTGIKQSYVRIESNKRFFKGRLLLTKHIQKNICDETKFYVSSEEYSINIPHNRIIVYTLEYLSSITRSTKNKQDLFELLSLLDDIPASQSLNADFSRASIKNRLFSSYDNLISWSRQILSNEGFTTFSGKYVNQSLLFSAESLFECFIAHLFKKYANNYIVHSQHQAFFLVDNHSNHGLFRLRPDIYLDPNDDIEESIIIDTKWKNIDGNKIDKNYLIDIKDMYQLYGYGRKYSIHKPTGPDPGIPKLVLIYPYTNNFTSQLPPFVYEQITNNVGLKLLVVPFNLVESSKYEQQVYDIINNAKSL